MGKGRVICVGHAAFDSVYRIEAFPARPTKVAASRHDRSVGGMAANAACAIAALGGQVAFWGPVGDDEVGARIVEELRAAGVDTDAGFVVAGARSSHSAIVVEATGERLIVSYRGDTLGAPDAPVADRALDADVVMIDVRWPAGALRVASRARAQGVPIVLDGEMGNADLLRILVPQADHVIFSETGWTEWLGHTPGDDETRRELSSLVAAGASLAAVTLGERGVLYARAAGIGSEARPPAAPQGRSEPEERREPAEVIHLPAFAVAVVETLGAGDAFHGAYALALAQGQDLDAAIRFAAAAAALRCTRPGGRAALPSCEEVQRLLAAC